MALCFSGLTVLSNTVTLTGIASILSTQDLSWRMHRIFQAPGKSEVWKFPLFPSC